MKTKKLLLALPMVAILASCSAKIDVYRDIFKDARALSDEEKQQIVESLDTRQYHYTGTRVIETYMDNEEIGRKESSVVAEFSDDETYGIYSCSYTLGGDVKYQASYDTEQETWQGDSALYEKFKGLIYSWNGHVLVGNFDVVPYDYNTKLLNCVSTKFTKEQLKNVKNGSFNLNLSSPASYSDGEIRHQVDRFSIRYVQHRITDYSCSYRIVIEDAGIVVITTIVGTFDYTYIH